MSYYNSIYIFIFIEIIKSNKSEIISYIQCEYINNNLVILNLIITLNNLITLIV